MDKSKGLKRKYFILISSNDVEVKVSG